MPVPVHRFPGDHPRVCGEKLYFCALVWLARGSPPRMRGKDELVAHLILQVRITPAYAGKSALPDWKKNPPQDHPRMCGEKGAVIQPEGGAQGSPPRMRGKEVPALRVLPAHRIIPACAGKRFRWRYWFHTYQDHPRVCGEKCCCAASIRSRSASRPSQFPPRMTVIRPRP